MSGKRQKNQQLYLAFATEGRGASPDFADERTEPLKAMGPTESPASEQRLIEEVCESENVEKAWKRVRANKGGPGADKRVLKLIRAFLNSGVLEDGLVSSWASASRTMENRDASPPRHLTGSRIECGSLPVERTV